MKDAGVISNLDPHALEEWLHSEELHRLQAPDGAALTCLNSLLTPVQKTNNRNEVVGFSIDGNGPTAFLWRDNVITDLNLFPSCELATTSTLCAIHQ
jgi:probable HAF family extracellular repeat protein